MTAHVEAMTHTVAEGPHGWRSVLCGTCRALGLFGGAVLCGAQLAVLAAVIGLVVLLFAY